MTRLEQALGLKPPKQPKVMVICGSKKGQREITSGPEMTRWERNLWNSVIQKGQQRPFRRRASADEVTCIVSRFSYPFQMQARKDLETYNLHDAIGMWLTSKPYLSQQDYETAKKVARWYLRHG